MVTTFGEYIKQRRTELGFPLRTVASHLDIDTSTLGKIEREERHLSTDLVPSLAEILKTEQKELFTHYYSSKVIQELKDYSDYKDVLNIVNEHLELYISNQIRLSFQKNWTEKEFENPQNTTRIATLFSGIGAIEYAFKRCHLKTEIVFACDNDKFVKESYFANYDIDEERWYDDVRNIKAKKYKDKISESSWHAK